MRLIPGFALFCGGMALMAVSRWQWGFDAAEPDQRTWMAIFLMFGAGILCGSGAMALALSE